MFYVFTDSCQELHARLLMLQEIVSLQIHMLKHESQLSISLTCVDTKKTDVLISLYI